MSVNETSVRAAKAAIEAHSRSLGGIDGDSTIQVWHILASLHEYCAAKGVDFDAEVKELRESILNGDLELPATEAHLKAQSEEGRKKRSTQGFIRTAFLIQNKPKQNTRRT